MLEDYLKQNGSDKKYPLLFSSQDDAYAAAENYKASLLQDGDEVLAEKISMTPQPQISMTIEDQSTGNVVALVGAAAQRKPTVR